MKRNYTVLLLSLSLAFPLHALAKSTPELASSSQTSAEQVFDMSNPYALIQKVSEEAFGLLKKQSVRYQADPELLRGVAKKYVMPYINVRYAALKVLGPAASKASKQQRDAFTDAFYEYLIASYAQILTQYTDQEVIVEKNKPIPANRKIVSVRVDIKDPSRPPIRMDFKLRKNNKTGDWQGFDVQVEGVSMLSTKTSEWSGMLRKEGIDKVTQMLIERAKMPIKKDDKA